MLDPIADSYTDRICAFVGRYVRTGDRIIVSGARGEATITGTPEELTGVAARLDAAAFSPLSDIANDRWAQLDYALASIGALIDVRRSWLWFHLASSNPPLVPPAHDPMRAYELRRHQVDGPIVAQIGGRTPSGTNEIAARRRSVDLAVSTYNAHASFDRALALAADAYEPRPDGSRPVASGGALYPLHFWVVAGADIRGQCAVRYVDHDAGVFREASTVEQADFAGSFVPDAGVQHALTSGASVVVIAADPTRVTYKYGDRGWRYAMIEVGAVSHHVHLNAVECGAAMRPVAGFFEESLADLITGRCHPLLTLFVGNVAISEL